MLVELVERDEELNAMKALGNHLAPNGSTFSYQKVGVDLTSSSCIGVKW